MIASCPSFLFVLHELVEILFTKVVLARMSEHMHGINC